MMFPSEFCRPCDVFAKAMPRLANCRVIAMAGGGCRDRKTLAQLLRQTFREWREDKVPRMGAAIAYYSVFSLAPLILTAIGIASIVFGREAAQGAMAQELEGTVGPTAALAIEDLLKQTHQSGQGHAAAFIGIGVLLFGASGVFIELQDALNTIWKVDPRTSFPWWHVV